MRLKGIKGESICLKKGPKGKVIHVEGLAGKIKPEFRTKGKKGILKKEKNI